MNKGWETKTQREDEKNLHINPITKVHAPLARNMVKNVKPSGKNGICGWEILWQDQKSKDTMSY